MKNALQCVRGLGFAVAVSSSLFVLSQGAIGQKAPKHVAAPAISDWSHSHLIFPESKDNRVTERIQKEIRWQHNSKLRHRENWWPEYHGHYRRDLKNKSTRDWNTTLGSTTYEPIYDFNFALGGQSGYGSLNTTDTFNGGFAATVGSLTVSGASSVGNYTLQPAGTVNGSYTSDNVLFPFYPGTKPIDSGGLLFTNATVSGVSLYGGSSSTFGYYDSNGVTGTGSTFNLNAAPGAGQTYPAKFVFDTSVAPSCSEDFVAMGIPTNAVVHGQANIVGYNNLYTEPTGLAGYCAGTGPSVEFSYASGSGEVPASIAISQTGRQLAYVENLLTGSSYFHVLTIGTSGNNGSPTNSRQPGNGNNAVDKRVLLSPDGGTTNQSSSSSPFINYSPADSADFAYVTTYSRLGGGSGYLYKIKNVFNGSVTPTIVWSVAINAVPSTPVYDAGSAEVFWTDNAGRIDSVTDTGGTTAPSVVYGAVLAAGTTSENPVVVDSTHEMVYATFNTNGANAIVVQAPIADFSSAVTIPVGAGNTTYGGPYQPDFNEAFYSGLGIEQMYVVGTGNNGITPTLYGIYISSGILNPNNILTAPLATGIADASPVTEFYNPTLAKDLLFVGVTNHCIATTHGGSAGCAMSLDITTGFPLVNPNITALPAAGGTTGIIVDNDGSVNQSSNIYYGTKTGSTLVKATQSGLN
jgi:hypothetical protein